MTNLVIFLWIFLYLHNLSGEFDSSGLYVEPKDSKEEQGKGKSYLCPFRAIWAALKSNHSASAWLCFAKMQLAEMSLGELFTALVK